MKNLKITAAGVVINGKNFNEGDIVPSVENSLAAKLITGKKAEIYQAPRKPAKAAAPPKAKAAAPPKPEPK